MSVQLEHGKEYRDGLGFVWEVWVNPARKNEPLFIGYLSDDGREGKFSTDGRSTSKDRVYDLIKEQKEPSVFRIDASPKADLAVAYSLPDDRIGFTLTVAGKSQQFEMTRGAAASFVGRLAEALK
jgi:hypothetical protein